MQQSQGTIENIYRNIPLTQLRESPTNPRRRFDPNSLRELADSFQPQGVLQPLLVRTIDENRYEIVAGARRFRAAQLAGLTDVPARVVELSDSECVLAQLTENIQREDVHPMEEALAFDALLRLESPRYDIATVAEKAGKSAAFVAQRQRLVELRPSIAEAFLEDRIGVGHALAIARLPQAQQERAFEAAARTIWADGGHRRILLPVRDFAAWIEQNILLSLDRAPFDQADATLVPEAGGCTECPKRTGFNTLLFGEMSQNDRCTDAACFQAKITRTIERQIEARPKLVQIATGCGGRPDGAVLARTRYVAITLTNPAKSKQPLSPYQKPCKHMAEAIVVDGAERGQLRKVCAEPTCAVHFADRSRPDPVQLAKEREQRRRELEKRKLEATVRHRTLVEVLRKVASPIERGELQLIAESLLAGTEPLRREELARRHKVVEGSSSVATYPQLQKGLARLLRQLDETALAKLIVEIALLSSVESIAEGDHDRLLAAAKRHRVDLAKVRSAVEAEFAAKATKAAAKQAKAAKVAKTTAVA